MTTSSLVTSDGVRIVYDVTGRGPAIVLLHGGGVTRQEGTLGWNPAEQDRMKRRVSIG